MHGDSPPNDTFLDAGTGLGGGSVIHGDYVHVQSGALSGGDDLIDVRNTDVSALSDTMPLYDDVFYNRSSGAFVGGRDTIHRSAGNDVIYANEPDYA